jgi:tetratricopeptide (TPR) repeat protein
MRLSLLFVFALVMALSVGSEAQTIGASERYGNCMRDARSDPERGLETALVWRDENNSRKDEYAAAHCEAVALTGLGQFETAAKRLEALATLMSAASMGVTSEPASPPKAVRAEILAQAGQAWFQADQTALARAALSTAVALDPENVEIRIDRAMTRAADGAYWDAIDDLNMAISVNRDKNQKNADAYALRASAYRFLDVLSLAKQDADTALRLAPNNAEALLEQGIISHMSGDDAAARKMWIRLVRLHEGTPAADSARKNLAKLK